MYACHRALPVKCPCLDVYCPLSSRTTSNMNQFNDNKQMNNLKRPLTLDFNQAKKNVAFPLSTGEGGLSDVLSSPDLIKLKVDTPELENMILGK
ncbi:hypothetical protein HUJ04_007752 [Dendroctonus ponderosae]|nr:hypothetical protein HUJ04_007752 [Dendroctonus ponderosae]